MDRKRIIALAVLLASALSAHALDLEGTGLKASGTAREGQRTIVTLKDSMDRTVQLSYVAEPDAKAFARILAIRETFLSWTAFDVASMRFTLTGATLEIVVNLDRVTAGGKDVTENVPAGFYFTWTGILQYDFRVVKDNVFLRISGPFTSEKELADKIHAAVSNPAAFLRRSDPEYYIPKVEKLEMDVPTLQLSVSGLADRVTSLEAAAKADRAGLALAEQRTRDLADSLRRSEEEMREMADGIEALRASQQALAASNELLGSRLESLKGRVGGLEARDEAFAEQVAALEKKNAEAVKQVADRAESLAAASGRIRGELESLRYAVMTFHDVEWLFWQVPVPKDGLAKALELKAANPSWGLKELSAALKEAEIKMTDQQINLVLAVYYNEFPK